MSADRDIEMLLMNNVENKSAFAWGDNLLHEFPMESVLMI
jgi:hypothetical protein